MGILYWFAILCIVALFGLMFLAIRITFLQQKEAEKFRKVMKVGDETNHGTITEIRGDAVYVSKCVAKWQIYPKRFK